ncbi:MAG TPA: TlpA disulfide reductase family protein [Candidatus Acidoferrum sp.]|nr:TlpA disulfide reductase family protein [Candidatus Acidoferrum sp.]
MKLVVGAAFMGCLLVRALAAGEEGKITLKIGDPAPKLQAGKWVRGDPVRAFDKDKVYVVEFWATWCGPCRASIPHLNEIHNKFKDKGLVVIGLDCWERDESRVAPFIKDMGDKMTYRVALDDKTSETNGAMAKTWMAAAGQNGIPTAFIVDKTAHLAWIGHPSGLNNTLIEQVLAGQFDVKRAAAEFDKAKADEAAAEKAWTQLSQAMKAKSWDQAEAALKELIKATKDSEDLDSFRLAICVGKGELDTGAALAERICDKVLQDAALQQNNTVWPLLSHPKCEGKALETAARIAERACAAAGGTNAYILDTLAFARFREGKKSEAIALQKKAVALASADRKEQFQKNLASYEAGKLPKVEEEPD